MLNWNSCGKRLGIGGVPVQNKFVSNFYHFRESMMAIIKVINEINKLLKRFNKNTGEGGGLFTQNKYVTFGTRGGCSIFFTNFLSL